MRVDLRSLGLASAFLGLGVTAAGAAGRSATFNISTVQSAPGQSVTIKSQCWINETQARVLVKHPLEGERIVLVTGGYEYLLIPEEKKGLRKPLPAELKKKAAFDGLIKHVAFDASKALSKAKVVGKETVAGYMCDVFSNSAKRGDESHSMKVWVPQKMSPKFPVKGVMSQTLSKPGATLKQSITISLSNIKLNPAIPASTFKVPAGYKIIDAPKPKAPAKPAPKK